MDPREIIIKEKLNPNIKNALYSNFSNAYEAIQEIVDNSVSHRIPGEKMKIDILFIANPKKIAIYDVGGEGMDIRSLNFFFNWGETRKRNEYDIGLYSQGGKSAIGYLGRSFSLITSPINGKEAYKIEDDNLMDTTKLKEYKVFSLPARYKEGYTFIEIGDLKFNVSNNFKEKLKEILIETYRPLIEKQEIEIAIDKIKINIPPFPLDREFKVQRIDFDVLSKYHVKGWVGRLISRSGLKGGIRCYYKGRLICGREFFGHPDPSYKASLNFLIGEVFLNFVPVNTNKTDFHRESEEWKIVQEKMYHLLQPHINELLGREVEEPTEEDINRVKKARDLFQTIMKLINKKHTDEGMSFLGEDHGQKPPEVKGTSKTINRKSILEKKYQPRTPPPTDKIGIRRRLRRFMDWDIRPMDETIRSKIEESKEGKILIINNMFPGYKESKGNYFYLLETAALQTVPIEDTSLTSQKYLEEFDYFFGKICENIEEAKEILKNKRRGIIL